MARKIAQKPVEPVRRGKAGAVVGPKKTARPTLRKATRPSAKAAGKTLPTWAKRSKNVTDDDVRHVVEHGVAESDDLLSSAYSWVVKLAKRIRLAYDMIVAWWMGQFDFPKSTVAALTLALLYFINPFDLIPDMIPGIGIIDDAVVFAWVSRLMATDAKRYAKKFGLKLADLGL